MSVPAAERLSVELLEDALRGLPAAAPPIEGSDAVLAALPGIHARYVRATWIRRSGRGRLMGAGAG